jgi:hypothetical protein
MRKLASGIVAALAATVALPATAMAYPVGVCQGPVGPVLKACVSVDPEGPYVQSLVIYDGNKYLLKVDPRTGEVSLCKYTATGYDCYTG